MERMMNQRDEIDIITRAMLIWLALISISIDARIYYP
jgi:hypothetical protein